MLLRVFMFLLGYALTVIGLIYIISYLNLLAIGYNFLVYEINKELEKELSLIINFINSKGYLIKNLEEHLSE